MEAFKYGKPVTGKYFVNREKELNELFKLVNKIKLGAEINVALIGLRRTGKTSILINLMNLLNKDKKIIPVFLDCYGIPSKTTFAKLILEKIKDAYIEKTKDLGYGKRVASLIKQKASILLSKVATMEISVANYLSLKMAFREGVTENLWEKAFEYAEILAKSKDLYFIVMLDEFPDIAIRWKEEFIKRFRSIIQQQNRVMYILTGSAVSYMIDMVNNIHSPLYRQLTLIRIEELPKSIISKFVKSRLKIDDKALDRYITLTGCFPDYVQRLGHIIASRFGTKKVTIAEVEEAYLDMLSELNMEFASSLDKLNSKSKTYGDMIISLSKYESPVKIAENIRVPQGFLPKYLNYLIEIGIVRKLERGKYRLTDPVFRDWVLKKFELFYS